MTTPARALVVALCSIGLSAVVAGGASAAPAAPAAYAPATYSDSSSGLSLTTGSGTGVPGTSVTLARVPAYGGGTYRVDARVVLEHVSADSVDLASVSVGCRDKDGKEQRVGHFLNTLRSSPVTTLEPHVVMRTSSDVTCWVSARAMRINTGTNYTTAPQTVRVRQAVLDVTRVDSRARASEMHAPTDGSSYTGRSRLVMSGTSDVPVSTTAQLYDASQPVRLQVRSQLQLTSCSHKYGSSDDTTGGEELCLRPGAYANVADGPLVYTQLFVRQMTPSGAVCRTVEVPGARTYQKLSAVRHHAPRYSSGTVDLPADSRCGTEVRAFTRVRVSGGPALVVHWPGTAVSVTPVG